MNNRSMADFICELRKTKNLTQKQLAGQLDITDKAVSKWERGLGYPDITTLAKLAEALGVTTNELLNGCREKSPVPKADIIIQNTLQYAEKVTTTNNRKVWNIVEFIINVSFVLAILVCVICDLAISKGLTWSLYPIVSIVFTWLVIMPLFHFANNKMAMSLISLSIFVVPFLFCIEQIGGLTKWLVPLGLPISIISIVCLWVIFYLFKKMRNKWYASGTAFIMAWVLNMIINYISAGFTGEAFFDVWDVMVIGIVFVVVIILFIIGYFKKQKTA